MSAWGVGGWCVGSEQQGGREVKGHSMMVAFGSELKWFIASIGECTGYMRVTYGKVGSFQCMLICGEVVHASGLKCQGYESELLTDFIDTRWCGV